MKRRWIVVALLLVAAGAALLPLWLRRGRAAHVELAHPTTAGVTLPPRAREPGRPLAWLAQAGLSARRIAGRVTFAGSPVPGARVRLGSIASAAGVLAAPLVTTGADGRFDFGLLQPGRYTVVAQAAGRAAAQARVDLRDPAARPPPEDLVLELLPCEAALYGHVKDATGGPVVAEIVAGDRREGARVETDAAGAYELCLPLGYVQVAVVADGYGGVSFQTQAFGRVRRDFSLIPEAGLRGHTVRAEDGQPVAEALVVVFPAFMAVEEGAGAFASSAEDGSFHVDGVLPGRYRVRAIADGYASGEPVEVTVSAGQVSDEVTLRLAATSVLSGKVVADGQPVAGARVEAEGAPGGDALSQADGSFTLAHVPRGDVRLAVDRYQVLEPKVVHVDRPRIDGLTVKVEKMASVSGHVRMGKKPLAARVFARGMGGRRTDAGDDGAYLLEGLPPGRYQIAAESLRDGAFTRGTELTLGKGENRTGVDLDLDLVASVSGVVVDDNGAPLAGIDVRLSLLQGEDYGMATTASDGSFRAGALSGGGDYEVVLRRSARADRMLQPAGGGVFPAIHVADGNTHVEGVRLVVKLGKKSIAGRVVDSAGGPAPDVRVIATPGTGAFTWDGFDHPAATSDKDGRFAIVDLDDGQYQLLARAGGGAQEIVNGVAAGRRDVQIVLSAVGGVDGTLVGFHSAVQVFAVAEGFPDRRYAATVNGDRFSLRDLPAGTLLVHAFSPNGESASAHAEVPAGGRATVVLESHGTATVAGRVIEARDRLPVAGLHCSAEPLPMAIGAGGSDEVTDADGRFTLAVAAGSVQLTCGGVDYAFAQARLSLASGQTAHPELMVVRLHDDLRCEIGAGLQDGRVGFVSPGGPAEQAGLKSGDVIAAVDGVPAAGLSFYGLVTLIQGRAPGSIVALTVDRAGENLSIEVTCSAP